MPGGDLAEHRESQFPSFERNRLPQPCQSYLPRNRSAGGDSNSFESCIDLFLDSSNTDPSIGRASAMPKWKLQDVPQWVHPSLHRGQYDCSLCNNSKGPNIAGLSGTPGEIVRLFHPRNDSWTDHFEWNGPELVGRTPIGQATIAVLGINRHYRVILRESLIAEGVFPPA